MNLLKAGFEVTVWNRTPEKSEALVKAGAHVRNPPLQPAVWPICSHIYCVFQEVTARP